MKNLSHVDMKDIAKDWEARLTGKQSKDSLTKEAPQLMPKPVRNDTSL